jgi:hypothetical protein
MATLNDFFFNSDSRGLYRKNNAAVVDNVFVFTDGVDKWEMVHKNGKYIAKWGMVTSGSDMTSKLNTILAHANVYEVVFDYGDITISGAMDCQGKKISFRNNGRLTGSGSITNATISAPYRHHAFASSLTITNSRVNMSKSSVMWYGATGSGSGNDAPYIQKAGDTAIANPGFPRDLYFPKNGGSYYRCTSGVLFHNWNGTDYQFFSLNLVGQTSGHFTTQDFSTSLYFTDPDNFAIGYQRARSSKIKGLSISGPMTKSFGSLANQFTTPFATWTSGSGCRDTVNSPNCGIAIDPVFQQPDPGGVITGVPEAARYPGWLSYYRGTGSTGGSSGISIEDCRVAQFVIDVSYSVNGVTLNAENMTIERVSADVCKVAFAYCQAQQKGNTIKNTIHWDRVHTVVDSSTYGTPSGLRPQPPNIDTINIAGGTNRLFNIGGANFSFTIKNVFGELLHQVGTLYCAAMINCEGWEVDFDDYSMVVPEHHVWAVNVEFSGCTFRTYDDLVNKRMYAYGSNIFFNNCRFDLPPLLRRTNNSSGSLNIDFKNCTYRGGQSLLGGSYVKDQGFCLFGETKSYASNQNVFAYPQYSLYYEGLSIGDNYPDFEVYIGSVVIPSINASREASLSFSAGTVASWMPYDYIVCYETLALTDPVGGTTAPTYHVIGRVKTVDYGTGAVTIDMIPKNITATTFTDSRILMLREASIDLVGDTVNGSNVISNVIVSGNYAPSALIGYRVAGVRVIAADNGARTITISQVMGITGSRRRFNNDCRPGGYIYRSNYYWDMYNVPDYRGTYLPGDIWECPYGVENNGVPTKYVCWKPGYASAVVEKGLDGPLYQAEWHKYTYYKEIPDGVVINETITLSPSGDTSQVIAAGKMITSVMIKNAAGLTGFKIGTTNGGEELSAAQAITAGEPTTIVLNKYSDAGLTLYFGGITSASTIKIYQQ